jgi:hypothetical protein
MENQALNSTDNSEKHRRPRSGGPQSPDGKARSAKNARRHGVLSEDIVVLRSERQSDHDQLVREYYDEFQPVNLRERELVDEMIWAKSRQKRAIRVETATIDERMDDENQKWTRECPTVDDDTRTASAIKSLVDDPNELQHLSRYETRFHRMYHRALRLLLELQEKRLKQGGTLSPAPSPDPHEPVPSSDLPNEQAAPAAENANLPNEQPLPTVIRVQLATKYHPRNIKSSDMLIMSHSDSCTETYSGAKLKVAG